ncbi:MAG TPA: EfeM/EfeO family lipoprotein [Trebonia sp.]|nr:EfeM/EfeO family lipoprotein [Trebonia sp.]
MRTKRLLARAAGTVAIAALATTVAACGGPGSPARPANMITVSDSQCGGTWHVTKPGWQTFQINNQGVNGAEVDLINPASGAVYGEIENSGPGTVTPMSLDVGSGKYAFLCLFNDSSPQAGPTVTVAGNVKGTPAILPVTYNDLIPLAKKYQADLEAGIKVLAGETDTLEAAVKSGNLTAAKGDWLTAHLQYESLGDAYGAFGDYDTEIDGRADSLGVSSPKWTGFYRLEYGLWHGQSDAELTGVARTLDRDVHALLAWWPSQQITLSDLGRRAHEQIENALQFQLSGHDDYGSGTTLASTVASIQASRVLLGLLQPLLAQRYPGLPQVYTDLDTLRSLLEKEHLPNGSWVPVSALSTQTREQIDAACDQALTDLAPVASITEPRNTAHDF